MLITNILNILFSLQQTKPKTKQNNKKTIQLQHELLIRLHHHVDFTILPFTIYYNTSYTPTTYTSFFQQHYSSLYFILPFFHSHICKHIIYCSSSHHIFISCDVYHQNLYNPISFIISFLFPIRTLHFKTSL
eukprot:UN02793